MGSATTYKVPLREVLRGVAQGHMIIITTGRNDHFIKKYFKAVSREFDKFYMFVHTKKNLPGKKMNSDFTRSTSWVCSIAVLLSLFGYSR